jgi:capsular polysaccharide export protein
MPSLTAENCGLTDLSPIYALGFSVRKRRIVRRFLTERKVCFIRDLKAAPPDATLAVWGNPELEATQLVTRHVLRIEDGFLRSVGLGAELAEPLSLVVDARGLYYDATRPSDLEYLLEHTHFDVALLERAARLRANIVDAGITKYNVGSGTWRRPVGVRRVVLVVGQVESDAALRHGALNLYTNIELLQAVRAQCSDAYIVYKPHPDVLAGLRAQGKNTEQVGQFCDEIARDVAMNDILCAVDEVHVLTSLAGFEALLRGCPVTVYGQPFYAGWGLTTDQVSHPRRTRRLTLDQLVAGVLILYPRYADPVGSAVISPERALEILITMREHYDKARWLKKQYLAVRRLILRSILRAMVGRR